MNSYKIRKLTGMLLLTSLMLGCAKDKQEAEQVIDLVEPVSIGVLTEPVKLGTVSNVSVYEAYVIPYTVELSFERSGNVDSVLVNIGDKVKKGDIIAELNDESYVNQVEKIRERIASTESKYKSNIDNLKKDIQIKELAIANMMNDIETKKENQRKEELIKAKQDVIILEEKIKHNNDLMNLEITKLNEELVAALTLCNHHQIIAPFDGDIVAIADVSKGSRVAEGQPIIGLINPDDTRVICDFISEADINNSVRYYIYKSGKEYPITYIPYDINEYTSLLLKGETMNSTFLYEEDDSSIRQGDFVLICLVNDYVSDVLTVPIDSLHKDSTGKYVYIIEDGKKVKRDVIVGLSDALSVEIIEGIKEGELVYVEN